MISRSIDALLGFALSAVGVVLALVYARRAGLVDVPNDRSSHRIPTPRGGGIAIVTAVVAVFASRLPHLADGADEVFAVLGTALAGLSLIGWLDDTRRVPVGLRLSVHIACGCAVALLVNTIAPVPGPLNIFWLAWWIFWTAASINIVNFMDGIDGMVAAQGVVYGIFLFALLPDRAPGSRFGLILAAACFGFLLWNWAPAKMFLGDVGSGPLGLFFVIGGALALQSLPAALVFLPLFPLFFDALVTLLRRLRRGEPLTIAHRSHLYQRLANSGYGHALVTAAYALSAAIGAVIAVTVRDSSSAMMAVAILLYCLAIAIAWNLADARLAGARATQI